MGTFRQDGNLVHSVRLFWRKKVWAYCSQSVQNNSDFSTVPDKLLLWVHQEQGGTAGTGVVHQGRCEGMEGAYKVQETAHHHMSCIPDLQWSTIPLTAGCCAAGCWILVLLAGLWLLWSGYWILDTGYWQVVPTSCLRKENNLVLPTICIDTNDIISCFGI